MLKAILLFAAAVAMIGCGGNAATNSNSATNAANSGNSAVSNTAKNTTVANTAVNVASNSANANKPANTAATKPAEAGPQRITFATGKSDGAVDVTLGPGESKQYVVGAKLGQIFMVDTDSTDTTITLVKGKVAKDATLEEPGHYDTTLLETGDYVFEVKNTTKEELKTTVRVIISGK